MIFINSLINDFYNCCYLPIYVLDESLNLVCKCGYTKELEYILKEIDIIDKLKRLNFNALKDSNDLTFLDYPNEIKFVVTPYFRHNEKSICFLLGPFTFKEKTNVTTLKIYSPYVKRALNYIKKLSKSNNNRFNLQ